MMKGKEFWVIGGERRGLDIDISEPGEGAQQTADLALIASQYVIPSR